MKWSANVFGNGKHIENGVRYALAVKRITGRTNVRT